MSTINITNARKDLYNLVENVSIYHDPTLIVGTISLFASFLGAITGLSNYNYNKDIEETIES